MPDDDRPDETQDLEELRRIAESRFTIRESDPPETIRALAQDAMDASARERRREYGLK